MEQIQKGKVCTKCEEWKLLEGFPKKKSGKNGIDSKCKECHKQYAKQYRQENRELLNERSRQYNQENKEVVNERSRQYNRENRERVNERSKRYYYEKVKGKKHVDQG